MSSMRPVEDGSTPLRRSHAEIFAGVEEGLSRMAQDLWAQQQARQERERALLLRFQQG